jgi:hypothetical protein
MLSVIREQFLKLILGFGLMAFRKERDLQALQNQRELTVTEEGELEAAIKAANYAERRWREFASHGVIAAGQDLEHAPWWPTASESAKITFKIMCHAARAKLELHRFDPDTLDLANVNLGMSRLRDMNPDLYVD